MRAALVAGVGMTSFFTPKAGRLYTDLAREALVGALDDAGIEYSAVEQLFASFVYGDSASGQRAAYGVGMTGIPVVNVNNNCSSGSTALFLTRQAVAAGAADCAVALGFEQMVPGALSESYGDRPSPLGPFLELVDARYGPDPAPLAVRLFGGAGREYMDRYRIKPETFAKITVKARRHGACNPKAVFRDLVSVEQVLASPTLFSPLTRLQCCPPTCGAAAAIIVSEEFARRHGLSAVRIRIAGQAMRTDTEASFSGDLVQAVGFGMTSSAAESVYREAGIGPEDVDVAELHDCFTSNELLSYEALGMVRQGEVERFVEDDDNTYGGRVVTNPSGGLIAKGHPLGATGIAQCYELVQHLRGRAGERQVESARIALQQNVGLGGACVVTLYERAS